MKLHPRVTPVQRAGNEFDSLWIEILEKLGIKGYLDGYLIWNQIDRFWIDSARASTSPQKAAELWASFDCTTAPYPEALREIGDAFAKLVSEYELTYGEITSILIKARSSDVKYHIRVERHPDDPDKGGGEE